MLTKASAQLAGEQEVNDVIRKADRGVGNARIDKRAELGAPVVKRGRGRPRKVRKFDEDPKNESKMPMEIKHEVKYGEENKEPAVIIESVFVGPVTTA